jgi:protein gp37
MGDHSSIEWTEATWNPVTGCNKVSPGCDNCYAERLAVRLRAMGNTRYENGFEVTLHDDQLMLPLRWKQPKLVFVNSMSDLFHPKVPTPFIKRVFDVMTEASHHTFQLLTKRPKRAVALGDQLCWPPNLWLGTSIESQSLMSRADELRGIPAAVRFLSLEPLLGPLQLNLTGIGWVIVGGESGPGARPPEGAWIRDIRDMCVQAGVPFFFKQWGGRTPKAGGRTLDRRTWDEMPRPRPASITGLYQQEHPLGPSGGYVGWPREGLRQ